MTTDKTMSGQQISTIVGKSLGQRQAKQFIIEYSLKCMIDVMGFTNKLNRQLKLSMIWPRIAVRILRSNKVGPVQIRLSSKKETLIQYLLFYHFKTNISIKLKSVSIYIFQKLQCI